MNDLPSGWADVRLSDVATVVRGITFPASSKEPVKTDTNVCCLRTSNVQSKLRWDDVYYVPQEYVKRNDQLVQEGDVLMSMANSYELVGKVAIAETVPETTAFGAFLSAVRPNAMAKPRYLFHLLRSEAIQAALRDGSSQTTNIANISVAKLSEIRVPLAPIAEQQRIADKLDAVLARVDACRDRLARVAPLLKRFRQSVLAAATSGRLTLDWRRDSVRAWTPTTLGSLCTSISDGPFGSNLKSDDYTGNGARVVRLENIGHMFFDGTKETFVSMEKYRSLERHALVPDDLLFSSFVDEEVRICRFPADMGSPAINKADCFCLRVDLGVCDPRYLMYRLACTTTYQLLKTKVHGATRPRVNLGQLRAFQLLLPSRTEQVEIVRRVEVLFHLVHELEVRLSQTKADIHRLIPSLLAKAFRGELMPQHPTDESASQVRGRLPASPSRRKR